MPKPFLDTDEVMSIIRELENDIIVSDDENMRQFFKSRQSDLFKYAELAAVLDTLNKFNIPTSPDIIILKCDRCLERLCALKQAFNEKRSVLTILRDGDW